MDHSQLEDENGQSETLRRAAAGDDEALRSLFAAHRDRLKRMVHLRLSRRLASRVGDSDVLQEAFVEVARKLPEYAQDPKLPLFLWMRHLTALKLTEVHRRHLGTLIAMAEARLGHRPKAETALANYRRLWADANTKATAPPPLLTEVEQTTCEAFKTIGTSP